MKARPRRAAASRAAADWDAQLSPTGEIDAPPEDALGPVPPVATLPRELNLEQRVELLPTGPGVYLLKDERGALIYIGKALSLRTRVRSYLHATGEDRMFIELLRKRMRDVDFIVTDTEKEALLLENVLIKKHRPRYNIMLRDDKTYSSLRIDPRDEWPRLQMIRRRDPRDRALHFGPYASGTARRETVRTLQRIFPIRSCPDSVLYHRSRPCLLHHIGRCSAPCVGLVTPERYREFVQGTVLFLRGRSAEVLKMLRTRMEEFSASLEYERAGFVRDQIAALEATVEREKVQSHRTFDRDVIALNRSRGRMLVTVAGFRGGKLEGMRHYDFADRGEEDAGVMEEFLTRYYDGSRPVPRDVQTSVRCVDHELIAAHLSALREGPVRLATPVRGEKRHLVEMALRNGAEQLDRLLAGQSTRDTVLQNLQSHLALPSLPRRIECFDISNLQGTFAVGAMTCFIEGEPAKSQYRRFKIRTVEGQDDFASMREVVMRRFRRAITEKTDLPDLVVIDGGKGQLSAACDALEELGIRKQVAIISLAKERDLAGKHVEERVFVPGRRNPITFNRSDPALFLLMRIRDEAHRFGITFHRKLRGRHAIETGLEGIPGLGPIRQRALLKHFGSLARIRAASAQELVAIKGITSSVANAILARAKQ